jgi:hypothetical protein
MQIAAQDVGTVIASIQISLSPLNPRISIEIDLVNFEIIKYRCHIFFFFFLEKISYVLGMLSS